MKVKLTKKGDDELQSLSKRVCIKQLKLFVFDNLSTGNPLRDMLLSENDELDVNVFIVKMEIWLRLLSWSDK